MVPKSRLANMKDAPIGTEGRSLYQARCQSKKDAPTNHEEKKEYVRGLVPKLRQVKLAVMKDVPTMQRMEVCAPNTEQRGRSIAVVTDLPIK